MKKLFKLSLILSLGLALVGCSNGVTNEEITDQEAIEQMNTFVKEKVNTYFQVEVPTDINYDYTAYNQFVKTEESPDTPVHHATIFQANYKVKDPAADTLVGYGGILSPDQSELKGLIVSIAAESDATPQELSEEQLVKIASDFLKSSDLLKADETLTFLEVNQKSSSSGVSILNFETSSRLFAVGIDIYLASPVYFEFIDK